MSKRTLALINHQPIMLEGLIRIFGAHESLVLLEFGLPSSHTVEMIVRQRPDLVLMDTGDKAREADAIAAILKGSPGTRVVIFASEVAVEHAVKALEAGVVGYLSTSITAEELLHAVGAVLDGETFISQKIATKVIAALRVASIRKTAARSRVLNVREEQIVTLLLQGKTNREIAGGLGLREKTVKHYMTLLMQKLDARNRLELALAMRSVDATGGLHPFN